MIKFYEDLKDYILKNDEETKKTLIPYYETLYQLENYPEMKELLAVYEANNYELYYFEAGDLNFYSDGKIEVSNSGNPTAYIINLELGIQKGNHCQCEPNDEGYNSINRCCGINCDVHFPKVSIVKEVAVINHEFQGYERDLWELEDKWITEYDKDAKYKQQLENIQTIELQIVEYQKELEVAKSQLREN